MVMQTNLDNLNAIPEPLREHYAQNPRTGKWIVEVEGASELIANLNKEAKAQRERAEAAEAKLASADPEKLRADVLAARASESKAIADTAILTALDRGRATAEGVNLLAEKLAGLVKISVDDQGHRAVTVTGLDGAILQGGYADLVAQATAKWPSLFLGHAGGGSGAPSHGGRSPSGSNTITRSEFEGLPPSSQAGKIAAGVTLID